MSELKITVACPVHYKGVIKGCQVSRRRIGFFVRHAANHRYRPRGEMTVIR